jgi:uncharacterized membrane protein YvbJ
MIILHNKKLPQISSKSNLMKRILIVTLVAFIGWSIEARAKAADDNGSPKALVEKYSSALIKGDPEEIASCFDLSTKEGKLGSEAIRKLIESAKANQNLQNEAKKKFGTKGVSVIEGYRFSRPRS